jgi:hypothetical protein
MNASFIPDLLYRTSCVYRKTTRQIWIHISEFSVLLRIQGTNVLSFLYIGQTHCTCQNSNYIPKATEESEPLCSWYLSGPSLILGPYLYSPWPAFPEGRSRRALCPTGKVTLSSMGSTWLSHIKHDSTSQSSDCCSLDHNQLRIPKVILGIKHM